MGCLQAKRETMSAPAWALQHGPLPHVRTPDDEQRATIDLIRHRGHLGHELDLADSRAPEVRAPPQISDTAG